MKNKSLIFIIPVLGLLLSGCAERCFYQTGKGLEQCEHDLLECAYSDSEVEVCMQTKGYEYSDSVTTVTNRRRKKVTVMFEEGAASSNQRTFSKTYWIMDGHGAARRPRRILYEQGTMMNDSNAPTRKLIGYKARKDDSDKFVFIPVYEDEQEQ